MDLLVIRHAVAEDRSVFAASGRDDSARPLTATGRERMRRSVAGLRRVVPRIDVLGASPYTRAMQTARLVAAGYDLGDVETVPALVPDAPLADLIAWLQPLARAERVAIVGHEPHLGALVTWLITGREDSGVALKKGGACLVGFAGPVRAGDGVLQWLMTPRQLRSLGG